MAIAVVLEPSPSMSVAWTVSVYSGTLWGEKEGEWACTGAGLPSSLLPASQKEGGERGGRDLPGPVQPEIAGGSKNEKKGDPNGTLPLCPASTNLELEVFLLGVLKGD